MRGAGRFAVLPTSALVLVSAIVAVALGLLFFSGDQSAIAQSVEAAVALVGAAGPVVKWLLPRLKRKALGATTGRSVIGLPVAVPTGDLPEVMRGREQLMEQLHRLSRRSNQGPAVLAGVGGAGKSTVATSFAEVCQQTRLGRRHILVWWISVADQSALTGGLVTVARQLGASLDDLEVIRSGGLDGPDRLWELLDDSARRWLLIFDNADTPADLGAPLPSTSNTSTSNTARPAQHRPAPGAGTGWVRSSRRGLVIVTTRVDDRAIWGRNAQMLPVGRLSDDEAGQLLLDLAPDAGDSTDARKLAQRLGGLPLPMRIAGLHLGSDTSRWSTFAEYEQAFDDPRDRPRMLSIIPGIGVPDEPRYIVMRTWELSLDDLAEQGVPQARPLLRVLSCLSAPIPIPRKILVSASLEKLLVPRTGARGVSSEHRLEDALHGLRTRGLIEIRSSHGEHAILVQPVIADTNRAHLADAPDGKRDTELIRSAAVEIIVGAIAGLNPDRNSSWPTYIAIGPHIHALYDTVARQINMALLTDLVNATIMVARAYNYMGDIAEGERLCRVACSAGDIIGPDDRVALRARKELAWCLTVQRRWPEAEAIYHEILSASQRALGDDDPNTITTRNELAWAAACQHRWGEAEAAYREVLAARTRVLGPDDRATLLTRHELAWAIANQEGRERDAQPILEEVITARERVLGDGDRRILLTRRDLAWVAAKLGENPRAAVIEYQDVVRSFMHDLGEQHPDTLTTWHQLAWAMSLAGTRRAALKEYRKVLRAQGHALGENHPDTTATREALAALRAGSIQTPRHIL
jgi:tetratricopeptide (TPR) repeat protein